MGGGCAATGGYLQVLAADDDNGNLANGTPHMTAIRAAFERHEIHCATPAAVDSGCAGGPTTPPVLTVTPGLESASLSLDAGADAARYSVYRTEGVSGCDFGKIKIADVDGHVVHRHRSARRPVVLLHGPARGPNPSCFGPASNCAAATPTADPCPAVADFTLTLRARRR